MLVRFAHYAKIRFAHGVLMRPLVPSTKSRGYDFSGFSEGVRRYSTLYFRKAKERALRGFRGMGFTPSQNSDWKERAVRGCGRSLMVDLGQTVDTEGA